jgi:hypothetical protein
VGQEQGPLSLVSTTEGLLERECSGSGLEISEYGRRDPTSGCRSVADSGHGVSMNNFI